MQSLRKALIEYYGRVGNKEILEEAVLLIKQKKGYFKNDMDKLQADMLITYWDKGIPDDMIEPYASQVAEFINKLAFRPLSEVKSALPAPTKKRKVQYKKPTLPQNFENITKKAANRLGITPEEFKRIYQRRVDSLFEASPTHSLHFTPPFYEMFELFLDEGKLTASQIADKIKPRRAGKTRYADTTINRRLYTQERLGFIRREVDNSYSINSDFVKD
jgi:hypothetical protein